MDTTLKSEVTRISDRSAARVSTAPASGKRVRESRISVPPLALNVYYGMVSRDHRAPPPRLTVVASTTTFIHDSHVSRAANRYLSHRGQDDPDTSHNCISDHISPFHFGGVVRVP